MRQLFIVLGVSIFFSGCAELGTALSQMNEDMGAQCATYLASTDAYYEGEYHEDTSFEVDDAWADRRADYYASLYRFDIYYDTSPEGNRYRFRVYCGSYY